MYSSNTGTWSQASQFMGYRYRKQHTINGSVDGTLTNYQVMLKVYLDSGTDSGSSVYLNSHSMSSLLDVRFYNHATSTKLDYWIESSTSDITTNRWAYMWVEVDSLPTGGMTLDIVYGKNSDTGESSGDNAFLFFDDFLGSSINTSKWSTSGSGQAVGGSYLSITQSNTEHRFIYTPTTPFTQNTICRIKGSQDGIYTSVQDSYGGLSFTREPGGQFQTFTYKTAEERKNIGTGYTGTHIFEQIRNGTTSVIFKIDNAVVTTHTAQIPTTDLNLRCITYQAATGQVLYVDYVLVRKYTTNEPTHGSYAAEEGI
jgi:hypothetical protein